MVDYHEPVLLKESIDFLLTDRNGTYIDATFGGGGHSREILSRLGPNGKVLAFDVDDSSRQIGEKLASEDRRFRFVNENFARLRSVAEETVTNSPCGFLFDLGVSSNQIDNETGFSYRRDERLDMRLDKRLAISAYEVVNSYEPEALADVFWKYGEEPRSRALARLIVKQRENGNIETTSQLAEVIQRIFGKSIKALSRIFQAIRIEVNKELESLSEGLDAAVDLARRGGRIVVISYHSLEDRIVKEKFKYEASTCVCPPQAIICTCGKVARIKIITRKAVVPDELEVNRNRRARSAKLRVAEKII